MRIANSSNGGLTLYFARRELGVLRQLLSSYPCIPVGHLRNARNQSTAIANPNPSQQLLEEALAEHRAESRKLVQTWLEAPERVQRHASGWRIELNSSELECLLQLLNDVRVGNWVRLGCPEGELADWSIGNLAHIWGMEMAGHFQMQILSHLESGGAVDGTGGAA